MKHMLNGVILNYRNDQKRLKIKSLAEYHNWQSQLQFREASCWGHRTARNNPEPGSIAWFDRLGLAIWNLDRFWSSNYSVALQFSTINFYRVTITEPEDTPKHSDTDSGKNLSEKRIAIVFSLTEGRDEIESSIIVCRFA